MYLQQYKKIDSIIYNLSKSLNLLSYVKATNYFRQKRYFLKCKIRKPVFNYRNPTYNLSRVDNTLKNLKVPKGILKNLYNESIASCKLKQEIIRNIGNSRKIKNLSREIYGKPNKELIKNAKKILRKNSSDRKEKQVLTASDISKRLKKFFKKKKLKKWKIDIIKTSSASISSTQKRVKLMKNKIYSRKEYKRLKVHEIMGHVFRAANGYLQPFKIFAIGLPSYLSTEEGLAAYLEEKFKVESPQSKRRFALRVIAVNAVYENATFYECFKYLSKFEPSLDTCWNTTYRVFRGGGFLKDHVYLKGYFEIKDFLRNSGKLKDLYVGKIGLKHLELCKELLEKGILKPPKYLPSR